MDSYQLELLIVTETHKPLDDILPGKGRTMVVRGVATKRTGVALVSPQGKQLTIKKMTERLIHVIHPLGIDIIGGYATTEQSAETEKKKFWEEITEIETGNNVILLGDFNAGDEEMVHPTQRSPGKSNFELMMDFAQANDYDIQEHGPTWISPCSKDGRPSRTLDRCLVHSPEYSANTTVDFALRPADHAIVIVKLHLHDVDRNKGRPFNQLLNGIDLLWYNLKQAFRYLTDVSSLPVRVNEFWKAKRIYEQEMREKLQIIGNEGQVLPHQEAVLKVMKHFKSLWSESNEELQKASCYSMSPPPTTSEIAEAIQQLKIDTTLGKDKINPEHVKRSPQAIKVYQEIFNEIWRTGKIPQVWKDLRVKPIQKKAALAKPHEVRPITCVSVSTKILNSIIVKRTKHLYEKAIHPSQHAYRSGHSTETAVEQLLTAINKKDFRYVAFLDMSKAYDSVTRTSISAALERWNLPSTEFNLIVEQYTGCSVHIELYGYTAPSFLLTKGIRQGCQISCIIFVLIISKVLDMMDIFLYQKDVEVIGYSDDLVIAAKNMVTLKVAMKYLEESLQTVGLELNTNKTEIVEFFSSENTPTSLKWLGLQLTSNLTWEKEIERRCSKIREALNTVQKVLTTKRLQLVIRDQIQIAQGMLSAYARVPSVIKLTPELDQILHNELLCAVMKIAKIDAKKAASQVQNMRINKRLEKPNLFTNCEHCGSQYRNNAGLSNHLVFCEKNPNPPEAPKQKCPQCSEVFHTRGFNQHRKNCRVNITL